MKTNKRTTLVVDMAIIVMLCCGLIVGFKIIRDYNAQKISDNLEKAFDEVDRKIAIKQLSELRGMILEVEILSHEDIPQGLLLNELERITASKHFTGKYLEDFAFDSSNSSTIGDICDEFISQIDDQIYTIEFGAKGE